jgi:hypothetical protein
MRSADMELRKGQNMIEHEAEIFSRPARTWFQSEKEKKSAKGTSVIRANTIALLIFGLRRGRKDCLCQCIPGGRQKEGGRQQGMFPIIIMV